MKTIIGFFAREHGLSGLRALIASPHYHLALLVTHRQLPKSEDIHRSERPEFVEYQRIAEKCGISLLSVDNAAQQQQLEATLSHMSFDLIASISWRRLIPSAVLQRASRGGVNLHRGKLPDYPGAEPIKQALLKGDRTICISAHRLTEIIDGGEVLCTYQHVLNTQMESLPLEAQISLIKQDLTPHFGPLLMKALELEHYK